MSLKKKKLKIYSCFGVILRWKLHTHNKLKNHKKVYSNTKEDLLPKLGDYSSRSPILTSPYWLDRMMNFGT
jgi:hypothetical protein